MNIKQTITKGEAIDIADVEIYNSQVDGVNKNGSICLCKKSVPILIFV